MPDDFDKRLRKIEDRFDDYMSAFYRWLDELRTDHELAKIRVEQNEDRLAQNEKRLTRSEERLDRTEDILREIVDIQDRQGRILSSLVTVMDRIDQKLGSSGNQGAKGTV